ncbi:MAG: hypothetical protein ACI9UA_000088, partial [Pseudoalteromonas tetraodonis]
MSKLFSNTPIVRNGREQLDADGMGSPTPTPAPEKNLLAVILARNSLAAVAPSR